MRKTMVWSHWWLVFTGLLYWYVCCNKAGAQSGIYGHSYYRASASAPVFALGITADQATNSFVLGSFAATTTVNGTTLNDPGQWPNVFMLKFRFGSTNAPQWIKSPVTDSKIINARIGCDSVPNGYIAGNFEGTNLNFGTVTLTNNATDYSDDIFLAIYDTSGNFKFLTQAGGVGEDSLGDMFVDTSGNCYLTGGFQSSTFSAGSRSLSRQSTSGGDCFVLKYNSSGILQWMQSGSYARGKCIALDSANNCYVGGDVLGTAVFNGMNPSNQTTTNFLAKYNSSGSLLWIRGDVTVGDYLKADKGLNIYTTGTFSNIAQFGSIALTNHSSSTVFLSKYDTDGNVLWAQQLAGFGNDKVTGIAIDVRTNCWITGYFSSSGSLPTTNAFVARFDQFGNQTAFSQGNPGTIASGVAMGSAAGVIPLICGSYSTNFILGSTGLGNSGNNDIFVAWCFISPGFFTQTAGTNIVVSWPVADSSGYLLETNSDISSGNWTSVSGASSVNGQMVVTNNSTSGTRFFRLRHP